jgi:hypothetical protein
MRYRVLILLIGLAAVVGCREAPDVTIHEPGVYKGKTDELLNKATTREYKETLRQRLRMVQTDR